MGVIRQSGILVLVRCSSLLVHILAIKFALSSTLPEFRAPAHSNHPGDDTGSLDRYLGDTYQNVAKRNNHKPENNNINIAAGTIADDAKGEAKKEGFERAAAGGSYDDDVVVSLSTVETSADHTKKVAFENTLDIDTDPDTDIATQADSDDDGAQKLAFTDTKPKSVVKRAATKINQNLHRRYSSTGKNLCLVCFVAAPLAGRSLTRKEISRHRVVLKEHYKEYVTTKVMLDHYKRSMFTEEENIPEEWHEEVCSDFVQGEVYNRLMDDHMTLLFNIMDARQDKDQEGVRRYTEQWDIMSNYEAIVRKGRVDFGCKAEDFADEMMKIQKRLKLKLKS